MIFLDLDQTITDFETQFVQHTKFKKEDLISMPDEILWPNVRNIKDFWSHMPWMPDGLELWNFIKKLKVAILFFIQPNFIN